MFSCDSLVRSLWTDLNYGKILAVGGRGYEFKLLNDEKKTESPVFIVL